MTDMEFYWDIVMDASSVITIFLQGVFYSYFVAPFFQKEEKVGRVGITYIAVMLFLKFCPFEISGNTAYAIGVLAAYFVMDYINKENRAKNFFLAVTFYLVEWISWGSAMLPWDILYDKLILPPEMMKQLWRQFGFYLLIQIITTLIEFLIMAAMIALIHHMYVYKKEKMKKEELLLVLIPSFLVAAGRFVFAYFLGIYETDTGENLYFIHKEYIWIMFFYQFVSFAVILAMVIIYQRMKGAQQKEKEEAVLFHQIEDMKQHIRETENLYQEIRSMKHDMGNHILTLEHLYEESEEARNYVSQLKQQFYHVTVEMKSGNPVTDVILREKQKEALEKGITFYQEFHYPQNGTVNVFDISIILNNALNNAIEAAVECENPYISISSYLKRNAYLIEVKNSVTGKRYVDEESGLFVTTKKEEGHGFGLVNIRKVAQKYYGDIDLKQDEDEFLLCVMLMIF